MKEILTCNPDLESVNDNGDTPLLLAVKSKNLTITRMLIDKGALVSAFDKVPAKLIKSQPEVAHISTTICIVSVRRFKVDQNDRAGIPVSIAMLRFTLLAVVDLYAER